MHLCSVGGFGWKEKALGSSWAEHSRNTDWDLKRSRLQECRIEHLISGGQQAVATRSDLSLITMSHKGVELQHSIGPLKG